MMATTVDPERRPTPRAEGADLSDQAEAAFALALEVDPRRRAQTIERFWTPLEKALAMPPTLLPEREGDDVELSSSDVVEVEPGARDVLTREKGFGVLTIDLPVPDAPPPREAASGRTPKPPAPATAGSTLPEAGVITTAAIPDLEAPAIPRAARSQPRAAIGVVAPDEGAARFDAQAAARPRASDRANPVERSRPRPMPTPPLVPYDRFQHKEPTVYEQLKPGLFYIKLALLIVAGDAVYTYVTHETVNVAGFRPAWLAGPLLVIGIGVAAWRLLASHD